MSGRVHKDNGHNFKVKQAHIKIPSLFGLFVCVFFLTFGLPKSDIKTVSDTEDRIVETSLKYGLIGVYSKNYALPFLIGTVPELRRLSTFRHIPSRSPI